MDKRDSLVEKLSMLANISVIRESQDEYNVYIGGRHLVQGTEYRALELKSNPENQGRLGVYWQSDKDLQGNPLYPMTLTHIGGGELQALIEVRDKDIQAFVDHLNNFTVNMVRSVNDVHKQGFGLNFNTGNNFFAELSKTQSVNGDADLNGDGSYDATLIHKVSGKNRMQLEQHINMTGTIDLGNGKQVDYVVTDRVRDVIDKINQAGAGVVAYLDGEGKFALKAGIQKHDDYPLQPGQKPKLPSFAIRHLEDSGNFLTSYTGFLKASGNAGAFDFATAGQISQFQTAQQDIAITPFTQASAAIMVDEKILANVQNIAAASGKDDNGDGIKDLANKVGDGSNALRIVATLDSAREYNSLDGNRKIDVHPIMLSETHRDFNSYLAAVVNEAGTFAQNSKSALEVHQKNLTSLHKMRESVSGVQVDEELTHMIMYQHGYQASARVISTMDQLLDLIINRMK